MSFPLSFLRFGRCGALVVVVVIGGCVFLDVGWCARSRLVEGFFFGGFFKLAPPSPLPSCVGNHEWGLLRPCFFFFGSASYGGGVLFPRDPARGPSLRPSSLLRLSPILIRSCKRRLTLPPLMRLGLSITSWDRAFCCLLEASLIRCTSRLTCESPPFPSALISLSMCGI